jgi:hypothetical protein
MAYNQVQFGICNVHWAKRYDDGTYDVPVHMPGADTLTISNNDNDGSQISKDNGLYWDGAGSRTKTGELVMARYLEDFKTEILGFIEEDGGFTEGTGATSHFALMFEGDGDLAGDRFVWFDCSATTPTQTWATTNADGTITEATETSTITANLVEMGDGEKRLTHYKSKGATGYDTFFSKVPFAQIHTDPDAPKLSALAIGSLTLSPAFNSSIVTYTATTTNASDTVDFTAPVGVTVEATANGTTISEGDAVTWNTGNNTVTVTLTGATATTTYTVTVTKE